MSSVHLCPVCHGVGTVPASFYNSYIDGSTAGNRQVACRACGGDGVIIVKDTQCPLARPTRARIIITEPWRMEWWPNVDYTYETYKWPPPNNTDWITVSCGNY